MNNPFQPRASSFDASAIHQTIQRAFASAGLDTATGPMHDVTETIRRALAAGGLAAGGLAAGGLAGAVPQSDGDGARVVAGGSFEAHSFSNDAGSRTYKLYIPPGTTDAPRAVVVMLHGCTQSADDFAAGTQMNRLADEQGFLVVYPEQASQANASKCWNWFKPQDQMRGTGEPSLIAGIVREVVKKHQADPRRIYVAGLSAGAAMAVVMGETYPDLFAGVGAHSGLAYGSAHDIPSAMAAMKGGRSGMPNLKHLPGAAAAPRRKAEQAVPLIVFHGDRDHTVQQTNGAHLVQQARDAHSAQAGESQLQASTEPGVAPEGQGFSRTVYEDKQGQVRIESWTLHGAGHAWSGGHASGSYTDRHGPDASAEMVRFFLALPHAARGSIKDARDGQP